MGRIIGYQYDDNVQDGDAWIGSEDGGGRTKQYTAEAVANYLNIQGKISIVGQMTYKYGVTPLSGPGTFAVFGGGTDPVAFSAITKLTLSNTDVSGQRVVEFLNLLVGSDILISKQSAISTFGYYSIDSYAVNATDPAYYDLGVTFKSGNGSMEADKVYETQNFTLAAEENISTLQTTIDSGNTYQASPSDALWTWGTGTITATSTFFTSLLSSKRFKTTLIADGSYTDVLPNQINFNTATGNVTSITTNTALSSNIDLQLPSSSGTLALTTDITASPWDTVTGGINYANGNVGIGTTTPGAKFQVVGGSAIIGDDNFNAVKISANGSTTTYNAIGNGFIAPNVNFNINNQTKLTINGNSGNVGIGTTSPSTNLEVVTSSPANGIKGYTNTGVLWGSLLNTNSNTFPVGTLGLRYGPNETARIQALSQEMRLGYAQALMTFYTSLGEKMRIHSNGNVGIGTTSPGYKLDVSGSINSAFGSTGGYRVNTNRVLSQISGAVELGVLDYKTTYPNISFNNDNTFRVLQNGSTKLILNSAGNVGIGTTNPTGKLEVDSGDFIINADHLIKSKNAFNYIDIYKGSDASMRFRMGHPTVGRFQFLNNANTEVFTIDARNEK